MKLVYIEWVDAMYASGQHDLLSAQEAKLDVQHSAGILIVDDAERVTFVQDLFSAEELPDTQVRAYESIPKVNIKRILYFEVPDAEVTP